MLYSSLTWPDRFSFLTWDDFTANKNNGKAPDILSIDSMLTIQAAAAPPDFKGPP